MSRAPLTKALAVAAGNLRAAGWPWRPGAWLAVAVAGWSRIGIGLGLGSGLLLSGCSEDYVQPSPVAELATLTIDGSMIPADYTKTICCASPSEPVLQVIIKAPKYNVVSDLAEGDFRLAVADDTPHGLWSFTVDGLPLEPQPGGTEADLSPSTDPSDPFSRTPVATLRAFIHDCAFGEASFTLFVIQYKGVGPRAPLVKYGTQAFTIRNFCPITGKRIDELCEFCVSRKFSFGLLASGDNYQGYTFSADGSCSERVTDNAYRDRQFQFSPDATEVSYASNREGANEDSYEIYVAEGTFDNVRRLTRANDTGLSAREHAWSPDGARIVYEAGNDLFAIDAAGGGAATQLTTGPTTDSSPTFSQDSTRIAFVRDFDLWIMDADGSDAALVLEDVLFAAWSPVAADGRRIAVQRPGGLFVLEDDGSLTPWGDPLAPLAFTVAIAWSPDGQRLATHAGTGEMWISGQADSTMVPLGPNAAEMVTEGLSWRSTGP